jgi:hypothetical protein
LDKTDTEIRELLILLIAQNKGTARPDQGNELGAEGGSCTADIMLSSAVSKLHDTERELLWQSKS